ncbi:MULTISPECIES: hypothetical protein [Petrimonas]|jgi:hypothetical protein|uniref:Uncharacterized protein n=1 Tax=Petrimonas mucosa TaxID=1642646 RepID=A0A1G4GA14_9BACT|nr:MULTISPECIES: hypothetical protein [Petrimonas]MDD3559867.1 hypothetical protein [Petrimonas mucosa]SCM59389.1 putative protein {ECO:0000313/EMBL:CEA14973,1} [Petrimonas mucosa]HHT29985.1 hypothetical protein [Petrimonas mucosa]
MERKEEYIDKLLHQLHNLEAMVSAIKREESVSFSFFREAFQSGQEVMKLLHELEMSQIEEMKHQMGKLLMFLSESENKKSAEEAKPVEVVKPVEEVKPEKPRLPSIEAVVEPASPRKNLYAEGVDLPSYSNPKISKPKREKPVEEILANPRSLNDMIQAPSPRLDIRRGLSLNDRFYFQRELFDNDREAMNGMMARLNAFDNYVDVERYLREETSWDFDDEKVKNFLALLKKGFE